MVIGALYHCSVPVLEQIGTRLDRFPTPIRIIAALIARPAFFLLCFCGYSCAKALIEVGKF